MTGHARTFFDEVARRGYDLRLRGAMRMCRFDIEGAILDSRFVDELPDWLTAYRADDAGPLDAGLADLGGENTAPHRRNRKRPKTQDRRPLRRYKRRWKVERLFA